MVEQEELYRGWQRAAAGWQLSEWQAHMAYIRTGGSRLTGNGLTPTAVNVLLKVPMATLTAALHVPLPRSGYICNYLCSHSFCSYQWAVECSSDPDALHVVARGENSGRGVPWSGQAQPAAGTAVQVSAALLPSSSSSSSSTVCCGCTAVCFLCCWWQCCYCCYCCRWCCCCH